MVKYVSNRTLLQLEQLYYSDHSENHHFKHKREFCNLLKKNDGFVTLIFFRALL